MAKGAGERASKEALALFPDKLASPLSPVLQACHDVGEEAKMAGIVLCVGVGACSSQMVPNTWLAPTLRARSMGVCSSSNVC